nr:MAG TPA: hypothetical protein [Inoviridae sp.]
MIFLKKDDNEIFDSGCFWVVLLLVLVAYIAMACWWIFGNPREVFADQQIETRRFPSGNRLFLIFSQIRYLVVGVNW